MLTMLILVIVAIVGPVSSIQLRKDPSTVSKDAEESELENLYLVSNTWHREAGHLGPSDVPGLEPSTHYSTNTLLDSGEKMSLFTFYSQSQSAVNTDTVCNGYFSHLEHWTHSWVNLKMHSTSTGFEPATLELKKLYGDKKIKSVKLVPDRHAKFHLKDGMAYITISAPCQVHVDVDLEFGSTDTGPNYEGPPIHTYSIFANPPLAGIPKPEDPHVYYVEAGKPVPEEFSESILYFGPGVHTLKESGSPYILRSHKSYYLPMDAWVRGAFTNDWEVDSNPMYLKQMSGLTSTRDRDIKIYGYGTLAGDKILRTDCDNNQSPEALAIRLGVTNMSIIGPTFVDFPNHHLVLKGPDDWGQVNLLSDVKVIGWRANGDGVHLYGSWKVHDLFLRTQDDSLYIASRANYIDFTRIVTWNDANGAAFIFTAGAGGGNVTLTDSDALYSRSSWAFWDGGRVFSLRGLDSDEVVADIVVDGVRASDPLPTMPFLDINAHACPGSAMFMLESQPGVVISLSQLETTLQGHTGIINHGEVQDQATDVESMELTKVSHGGKKKKKKRKHSKGVVEKAEKMETADKIENADSSSGTEEGTFVVTAHMIRSASEIYRYNRKKWSEYRGAQFSNITFQNIDVANFSTVRVDTDGNPLPHGIRNRLNATEESPIHNLRFTNVVVAGQKLKDIIGEESYFYLGRTSISDLMVDGVNVLTRAR